MSLEKWQKLTCPDCEDGERSEASEDYHPASEDSVYRTCDECDGTGKVVCPVCHGEGEGDDCLEENYKGEDCWEGEVECKSCDGNGWTKEHCPYCSEELEHEYYHVRSWVTADGEIICDSCAREAGAYKCETCDGEGELPHESVTVDGRTFEVVQASCSCCGAQGGREGETTGTYSWDTRVRTFDWYVYRARMLDTDEVYFSYLCGDESGQGCLSDVLDQQEEVKTSPFSKDKRAKLDVVADLLGNDDDGLWSEMTD